MGGRILLVEPDVVLGAVLGEVLRRNEFAVTSVRSLSEGVEHIHSVDTVILDADTLSGEVEEKEMAVLDALRPHGDSPPMVLMGLQVSDSLHQRLRDHLRRRQATHLTWVQKPFRNDELVEAVRRVHESV